MKKRILIAALCVAIAMPAAAQKKPAYTDALRITRGVAATFEAMPLWHQKPPGTIAKAAREANALSAEAEKVFGPDVFGPFGPCVNMATLHAVVVSDFAVFSSSWVTGSKVSLREHELAMKQVFNLGDHYRVCRELVEQLDTRPVATPKQFKLP